MSTSLGEAGGHRQGVVSTDGHEGIDPMGGHGGLDLGDAIVDAKGVGPRAAQQSSTLAQDAEQRRVVEGSGIAVAEQASPSVQHANDLVAASQGMAADGSYGGIQAGGIATTSQHSDPHLSILPPWPRWASG